MQLVLNTPAAMDSSLQVSKKRRRSLEPLESASLMALPLNLANPATRNIQQSLCDVIETAAATGASFPDMEDTPKEDEKPASDLVRRSLMGLSLQLKLKTMLIEAWASDMNSVVIERNLFAIAKELAILKEMGVFEEDTCIQFVELARARMAQLLAETERKETLKMDSTQMWTMAVIQAQEKMYIRESSPRSSEESEFPLLSGYDSSSRDISVLWKAMSIARDRGAQLWHENKPEQALPFLVAADSYMKRFTLKYQRLKIDHAMLDTFQNLTPSSPTSSPRRSSSPTKRVSFADEPQVLGVADSDVDRSPISPTRPSKLESLLLRTSREFPTPAF
ncbi:hypothetical protein Poli38472_003113 [Pythium oligandrum]|uniref:Uncharacterized protein n=1 Tax=Pythium oligandrum TaxID=41045 RepID=A0A8K1C6I5_PYTOL|nr:hypothetical protein Poli38472_003113 [Pythium oligandrum]|eukprot:TMW57188.1 hypothetical protein Poli38472_003113 [Pythium oligandrum]